MEVLLSLVGSALLAAVTNPQVVVGLVVGLVLLVRDFDGVVKKLATEAIPRAEDSLGKVGSEKMDEAVAFVLSLLPVQYRVFVPAPLLKMLLQAIIQAVFNARFGHLDKSANAGK